MMILFHPLRLAQAYFGLTPPLESKPVTSSILLAGGTIIAFNQSSESLEIVWNGAVLVTDDKISAIYESIPNVILPHNTEILNVEGKIITPGFISTQNHGWLTPFKTIASNTTLAEYLVRYGEFSPANTLFTPEDVYIGTLQGMLESLNAGVTTILEHASSTFSKETSEAGLQAAIDSGMRILYAFAFHDLGFANYTVSDQIHQWRDIARSDTLIGTLVSLAIAYDRFSIASREEVEAVIELAL
jgi:cytosine/adenosine deaminase-related metal-dependent hydrolase